MQDREQIIKLGKILAEEQRQGCIDSVVSIGLEAFVQQWSREADGALEIPAVQAALTLLTAYTRQPLAIRQERLNQALTGLRELFRAERQRGEEMPRQRGEDNRDSVDEGTDADKYPQGNKDEQDGTPEFAQPDGLATLRISTSQAKKASEIASDASALNRDTQTPLMQIPYVGRNAALAFKRLGLKTAADLLYHIPHRYDDYSSQKQIIDLEVGAVETIVAKVSDARTFSMKNGRNAIEVQVQDGSGLLKVVFFGMRWLQKEFTFGRKIVLSGKVISFQGMRQMTNPKWEPYTEDELVHTGRLVPVHSLTKGLHERNARSIIKRVVDEFAPALRDPVPPTVLERVGLLLLPEAITQIHFPDNPEVLERARLRLGFDEFLLIQLGVVQRRLRWQCEMGFPLKYNAEVHADLLSKLSFALTGAQQRALEEIFTDLQRPVPMARLLQGDVGSGKTIVAAAALLQAIANGFQGALMAPTEILAEQHYKGLRQLLGKVCVPRVQQEMAQADSPEGDWKANLEAEERARLEEVKRLLGMTPEDDLGGAGVRVALLTGSLGAKERRRVLEAIAKGDVDLIIGTHALITESVQYHSLGLVCVDEQHRFGVEQRERLKQKGFNPHMLVMTATPIPRTLTLTIYGELDTSVLNELPPGRQEIKTRWITRPERYKAYKHIRKEVEKGRQAFVICPLVEESEKVDLPSAEEMYEQLQSEVFPDLRVALIHGRMLGREKDSVMRDFRDHCYDILVATAVVEVGIDVPNATTIVIDGAERFGLAQLHQFRGRVGRGQHQSYCILVSDVENEVTQRRLTAMEEIRDGFELAEIDLQLRGPGEFLGKRQSGTPDLKVAKLADVRLLQIARLQAELLLDSDPDLTQPEHSLLGEKMREFWSSAEGAS